MKTNKMEEYLEKFEGLKVKFNIKIFNSEEMYFEKSEEYIYRDNDVIISLVILKGPDEYQQLIDYWNYLLKDYEGMNYCVIDTELGEIIISGAFDPGDIESLEEYYSSL